MKKTSIDDVTYTWTLRKRDAWNDERCVKVRWRPLNAVHYDPAYENTNRPLIVFGNGNPPIRLVRNPQGFINVELVFEQVNGTPITCDRLPLSVELTPGSYQILGDTDHSVEELREWKPEE
jgi:hypothetical protein